MVAVIGGILGAIAGFVIGVVIDVVFWNNAGWADLIPFALAVAGIPLGAAVARAVSDRLRPLA
jgi:hypothetical protein